MKQTTAIFLAIGAATLYAFNSPISKLLLQEIPATMMAAFLYLGAGLGIAWGLGWVLQFCVSFRKKAVPLKNTI